MGDARRILQPAAGATGKKANAADLIWDEDAITARGFAEVPEPRLPEHSPFPGRVSQARIQRNRPNSLAMIKRIAGPKKTKLQSPTSLEPRAVKSCVLVALNFESPSSAWPDENPDPFTGRITKPFSANQGLHF